MAEGGDAEASLEWPWIAMWRLAESVIPRFSLWVYPLDDVVSACVIMCVCVLGNIYTYKHMPYIESWHSLNTACLWICYIYDS